MSLGNSIKWSITLYKNQINLDFKCIQVWTVADKKFLSNHEIYADDVVIPYLIMW